MEVGLGGGEHEGVGQQQAPMLGLWQRVGPLRVACRRPSRAAIAARRLAGGHQRGAEPAPVAVQARHGQRVWNAAAAGALLVVARRCAAPAGRCRSSAGPAGAHLRGWAGIHRAFHQGVGLSKASLGGREGECALASGSAPGCGLDSPPRHLYTAGSWQGAEGSEAWLSRQLRLRCKRQRAWALLLPACNTCLQYGINSGGLLLDKRPGSARFCIYRVSWHCHGGIGAYGGLKLLAIASLTLSRNKPIAPMAVSASWRLAAQRCPQGSVVAWLAPRANLHGKLPSRV